MTSMVFSRSDNANSQLAHDGQNDMMMFDGAIFQGFDPSMQMNLDGLDDMTGMQQSQPPQQQQQSHMPHTSGPGAADSQSMMMGPDASNLTSPRENTPVGAASQGFGGNSNQGSLQNGNTLTEFTKRRNWPAKVVEELKDFLHILDSHGRIKYVSPSVTALTGYDSEDLVDYFLRDLIHPDDVGTFTSEMNESIATGNPLRMFFRLKKKNGEYAIFESVGHAHIAASKFAPNPDNQSPFCQAVFMMSRPYPTKNATLLDTFLEHKIENERLKRRIAELRREEEEDEASTRSWYTGQDGQSDITASEDVMSASHGVPGLYSQHSTNSDSHSMPPPERPASMTSPSLTRENLEGSTAANKVDSIKDKMARFEGPSHTDTIEMLTGLRYVEGERSKGITTGNHSPTLIKGDAGIAIPMDRDPRTGDKKKKLKVAEEYVCTDCGTLDSPEWRKGPSGPKTLCNACGLRWAKKEKKRSTGGTMSLTPQDHQT